MADRIGDRLGNYTLIQLLGMGAFADVYLAEHIYLKTQVAIKILQARLSNAEDTNSFLLEAQTIARLSHPHIIRVLDFGLDGEIPFLVMDYAPGGTLRQLHPRETQLPLPQVISYVKEIADALQYAHGEKVIHRDIKPENVLLGRQREVLLSDFGIALIAQSSRYGGTQEVAGTVAYMSPEQIQGKARPASDQYALGIIVYEWISGDRPFRGSFTEVCSQHLFATLPPLREKVPWISPEVEHVIAVALAKDPKQRWASVQAFARALEQASQSAKPLILPALHNSPPVPATTPSTPETLPEGRAIPMPAFTQPETPATPPLALTLPAETPPPTSPHQKPATQLQSQPSALPPPAIEKPRNAWSIGSKQILSTIAGIIIFGIASGLINNLFTAASNDGYSSPPYQYVWLSDIVGFSIVNIAVGFILIIPAFFAVRAGPWTGLASAIGGLLLGNALSNTLGDSFTQWYTYITFAIFSFVAGLTFVRTRGRYTTRGALFSLVIITVIGLIISLGWQSVMTHIFAPPVPFRDFFLPMFLTFCLLDLPLLVALLITFERKAAH